MYSNVRDNDKTYDFATVLLVMHQWKLPHFIEQN